MTRFTLDTNILIWFHRNLARDIFPGPWEALENAIRQGTVCICSAVSREVDRGGDDLSEWVKAQSDVCCPESDAELLVVAEISRAYPGWVREQKNEADPWVVAHGELGPKTVVTDERLAGLGVIDKNQKIPNVAAARGVSCMGRDDWQRALGWRF